MIKFIYHPSIEKEITRLARKWPQLRQEGFKRFELLCEKHFNPVSPQQIIGPGKLHRITQNDVWMMWKVELIVPNAGLRPNQYPRVWFAVRGEYISFLCIATHVDNYNDSGQDQIAMERVDDIF